MFYNNIRNWKGGLFMSGIYRSSINDDLIKNTSPHRILSTDKFFIDSFSRRIEIDNFLNFDNIIHFGIGFSDLVHIDINTGLMEIEL